MTKKIYFSKISEELRNTLIKQSKDLEKLHNSLSIRPELSEGLRSTMKISDELHSILAKQSKDLRKLYNSLLIRPEFSEGLHNTLVKQSKDLDKLYNSLSVRLKFSEGLHNAMTYRSKDLEKLHNAMTYRSKDLERLRNAIAHQSQNSGNTLIPLEGKVSREVERAKKADSDNTVLPVVEQQPQNSDNPLIPLRDKVLDGIVLFYLECRLPKSNQNIIDECFDVERREVLTALNELELEGYIKAMNNLFGVFIGYVPTEKGQQWVRDNNRD